MFYNNYIFAIFCHNHVTGKTLFRNVFLPIFIIQETKIFSFLRKFLCGALKEKTTFRLTVPQKKKEEGTMYGLLKPFRL